MYPRNAASPERISIGPVIQISDGAVQTSGVTVRVLPFGGSEADGVGTPAYSTDGVVVYTPTQAETNYTSFVLIAKKTGCIPASVTVVTSASAVAGHAGTDQSKITNNTATVNLSGTTIKTATDVETDTQDIQSRLPAALVDGLISDL
jgi:tryptophan synthase beta subunit